MDTLKVKDLAEKAGLLHNGYPEVLSAEESVAAYQMFAELIVHECIRVTRNAQRNHDDADYQLELHFNI